MEEEKKDIIYPDTDLKFRIDFSLEDFLPDEDPWTVTLRNEFRKLAITKDDCLVDEENNELMPLPAGYDMSLAKISKEAEWQGLYMKNMYLSIPTIIEGSGKVDDSATEQVDEIVMQDGQQTVVKETVVQTGNANTEPLLRRILPNSPAYCEAVRLLKFLDFIVALQPSEIAAIPPPSIMREFIGGQTL